MGVMDLLLSMILEKIWVMAQSNWEPLIQIVQTIIKKDGKNSEFFQALNTEYKFLIIY